MQSLIRQQPRGYKTFIKECREWWRREEQRRREAEERKAKILEALERLKGAA